jgi:hypothetical protein
MGIISIIVSSHLIMHLNTSLTDVIHTYIYRNSDEDHDINTSYQGCEVGAQNL